MHPVKVRCPKCDRYLCETTKTLIAENVKCGGCKEKVNSKVVYPDSSLDDIRYTFKKNDIMKG